MIKALRELTLLCWGQRQATLRTVVKQSVAGGYGGQGSQLRAFKKNSCFQRNFPLAMLK